jgi:atypical dual specificity phosphatase
MKHTRSIPQAYVFNTDDSNQLKMTHIIDGLYVAGISEVMREVSDKRIGITHILNVASELEYDRSKDGYIYKHCGVEDDGVTNDISDILEESTAWIDDGLLAGGKVMVHCWSGVSRSVVVIMAYLMRFHGMSIVDAYKFVLCKRGIMDPWPAYLTQLRHWDHRRVCIQPVHD